MPGWIDKLRARAQETLQDPEKMASIKSKVTGAVSRRLAGGSQRGGYYGPGVDPGMTVYGDANYDNGNIRGEDTGGWSDGGAPDGGGWNDNTATDAGGWEGGGSSDSGGDGGGSSDGDGGNGGNGGD